MVKSDYKRLKKAGFKGKPYWPESWAKQHVVQVKINKTTKMAKKLWNKIQKMNVKIARTKSPRAIKSLQVRSEKTFKKYMAIEGKIAGFEKAKEAIALGGK